MKKTLLISLFALMLIGTSHSYVSAEEEKTPKARLETRKEAIKTTVKENTAERKENREEKRADVAANHADRLENRFTLYAKRLTALGDKIESRIKKREAEGKEVGDAKAKLAAARDQLAKAIILGEEAVKMFRNIDPAKYTIQRNEALKARDKANEAQAAFKNAHRLLTEAVKEMNEGKDK